MKGKCNSMDF